MGQLESLRELNIAEPNNKRKKKKSMPLLFILMRTFSESWDIETLYIEIIWKLHSFVLVHFTLVSDL
jgi:hypothetical protein